jgi:hypothetical protein
MMIHEIAHNVARTVINRHFLCMGSQEDLLNRFPSPLYNGIYDKVLSALRDILRDLRRQPVEVWEKHDHDRLVALVEIKLHEWIQKMSGQPNVLI